MFDLRASLVVNSYDACFQVAVPLAFPLSTSTRGRALIVGVESRGEGLFWLVLDSLIAVLIGLCRRLVSLCLSLLNLEYKVSRSSVTAIGIGSRISLSWGLWVVSYLCFVFCGELIRLDKGILIFCCRRPSLGDLFPGNGPS